nr:hypothetical protein Iba_chr09cCG10450 [Ipomoea batatas]
MMLAVAGCETTSGCSRRIELLPRSIQAKAAKPHSGSTPRMAWVGLALDRCEKDGEIGELQGDAESVDGHDENAVGMDEWHGIEHPHEAVHQCRMSARLVSPKTSLETIPDWSAKSVGQTGFAKNQSGLVSRLVGETSLDWFRFTETNLDWFCRPVWTGFRAVDFSFNVSKMSSTLQV